MVQQRGLADAWRSPHDEKGAGTGADLVEQPLQLCALLGAPQQRRTSAVGGHGPEPGSDRATGQGPHARGAGARHPGPWGGNSSDPTGGSTGAADHAPGPGSRSPTSAPRRLGGNHEDRRHRRYRTHRVQGRDHPERAGARGARRLPRLGGRHGDRTGAGRRPRRRRGGGGRVEHPRVRRGRGAVVLHHVHPQHPGRRGGRRCGPPRGPVGGGHATRVGHRVLPRQGGSGRTDRGLVDPLVTRARDAVLRVRPADRRQRDRGRHRPGPLGRVPADRRRRRGRGCRRDCGRLTDAGHRGGRRTGPTSLRRVRRGGPPRAPGRAQGGGRPARAVLRRRTGRGRPGARGRRPARPDPVRRLAPAQPERRVVRSAAGVAPEAVGPLLRRLRLDAQLTLERLSAASGIGERALSDIERGVARGPQHRTVLAITGALGLSGADRARMVDAARAGRREVRSPAPPAPPREVPDFVGREQEVARLTAALTGPRRGPVVVTGPAGYGKTTVALRAAHLLREALPDQVFVDLRGTPADGPSADAVVTHVLRSLTGQVGPPALARDRLSRVLEARPRLLVLDDAGAEWQLRALQPATDRTAVVVTSRRSLAGLDQADRLPLDRLTAAEAQRLLAAIIPPGQTGEADLVELARLCDHVPLALRIAGNRVASRPGSTAAALVDRLRGRARRLDALTAGDLQMRSTIGSSVDQLTPATRQLFRRLALLPSPTFAADHAAAVVDQPPCRTADMLEELVELNVVHTAPGDRYAMDDLF